MDAQTPSASPTFANRTPLRIGAVGLKARNLDALTNFYRDAIGLAGDGPRCQARPARRRRRHAARTRSRARTPSPTTRAPPGSTTRPSCSRRAPTSARWLVHAARNRVLLSGASDHLVSEAIYLDDPEGNGIEVYRDRLPEEWHWTGDRIKMATDRLDLDNLAAEAGNTALRGRAGRPAHRPHPSARRRSRDDAEILLRRRRSQPDGRPRWRAVHVVRALSPSRRQQCVALGRRDAAR